MYKDLEDVLAIQEVHFKEKKPFYKILKPFVLYSQLQKILKINIKRNILTEKKISQNNYYRAS